MRNMNGARFWHRATQWRHVLRFALILMLNCHVFTFIFAPSLAGWKNKVEIVISFGLYIFISMLSCVSFFLSFIRCMHIFEFVSFNWSTLIAVEIFYRDHRSRTNAMAFWVQFGMTWPGLARLRVYDGLMALWLVAHTVSFHVFFSRSFYLN